MKPARTAVFLLISCLLAPAAMAKNDSLPEVTEQGLHRVPDSRLAVVYAEPGADLSIYDSVKIVDVYVAFKKNWERDHNRSASSLSTRVKPRDMERIKTSLAEQFHDVFSEVLTEGGYQVTEETGENILLVRPAIIDLDPEAPDITSATATRTYTLMIRTPSAVWCSYPLSATTHLSKGSQLFYEVLSPPKIENDLAKYNICS